MPVAEELIDYSLLTAYVYLLLRLRFANHAAFNIPFFHWFVMTGFFSSLSVVGFIIGSRFTYTSEYSWVFKVTYVLNSFTVTAATIGKLYMSLHRLVVMRNINLSENIFFCDYSYEEKNGVKYLVYFDDACTVFEKSKSSVIYLIFVILSIILIVLISRQMFRLFSLAENNTRRLMLVGQRQMFIVVTVCSITHLIKAVHQMCWVLVAAFHLQNLNGWLQTTYPYTHYLSTYSGAVTLVIFNSRVRSLLISVKYADTEESTTTVTTLSRM